MSVNITVGHTPDADDAFMFYAMLTGRLMRTDFDVKHTVADIETLNKSSVDSTPSLDVTAVSVHACAHMPEYTILCSGGSFGLGYGPIVVAKNDIPLDQIRNMRIAVPGRLTSAFLLLKLMLGNFEYTEMTFSDIPAAVREGRVDAGLVIHETQLTYESEGIRKIADLGEWWSKETNNLPVPLGVNVARTGLGVPTFSKFDTYLRESIEYGLDHFDDAMDYAMQYARGKPRDLVERFVKMYVNRVTVSMGDAGAESICRVLEMGRDRQLVPDHRPAIAPCI